MSVWIAGAGVHSAELLHDTISIVLAKKSV